MIEVDRDIVRTLATGDRAGAATLALKGHAQPILLYLRSVLHDGDLADEAFSRFSEKLWRSIGEFRGECTFSTWAYRLAWYTTLEIKRGLARRRETALAPGVHNTARKHAVIATALAVALLAVAAGLSPSRRSATPVLDRGTERAHRVLPAVTIDQNATPRSDDQLDDRSAWVLLSCDVSRHRAGQGEQTAHHLVAAVGHRIEH